mgnify:CR=1 FL=1
MRPINSMIEFKQIIGRGTRLYDGKDYFTIHDFVQAHLHFNDPEWDGEPLEPPEPPGPGPHPPKPRPPVPPGPPEPKPQTVVIQIADGKTRTIDSMVQTTFWGPDGKPMSAAEFLTNLYGALPDFFTHEDGLRHLRGNPETRQALLHRLEERGFGQEALSEMRKVIEAEDSDIYDVLAYVAFERALIPRSDRAADARERVRTEYTGEQRALVDFVLAHYEQEGVWELDIGKLAPLLLLKYQAFADATAELGQPEHIRQLFVSFQPYLYERWES